MEISGNNISYTIDQFPGDINRTNLTDNSIDTTPSSIDFSIFGNYYSSFKIFNQSDNYKITLNPGSGVNIYPQTSILIYPRDIKTISFEKNGNTINLINESISDKVYAQNISTDTIIPINSTKLTLGHPDTIIKSSGPLTVYGNIYNFQSVASLNAAANLTYSVGQVLGGFIKRDCNGASRTDTFPTAASIVAVIPNADVGISFSCSIQNTSASSYTITFLASAGITLSTSDAILERLKTQVILFVIDNVNPGTEAITAYFLGTLTSAGGIVPNLKTVSTSSYTLSASDNTINVDTNTIRAKCTITLPKISELGKNKYYFITDSTGKAGMYNIVVVPASGDTIVGTSSVTMNSNYSSISLYNDEISNWILY